MPRAPLNVLLLCGPSASGKSFVALRLLSLHYEVLTESMDDAYHTALRNGGIAIDASTGPRGDEALSIYGAARELRTEGGYPPETVKRVFSELESIIRQRIELAHTLGLSMVFEGQTLKYSDEATRIAKAAKAVSGGSCRVVRAHLRPDREDWQRYRIAWAKMRQRRRPGVVGEKYYERKMSVPAKVEGVTDFVVGDMDEMRQLVEEELGLEKQELSAERQAFVSAVMAQDTVRTRDRIKLAEWDRVVRPIRDLLEGRTSELRRELAKQESRLEQVSRERIELAVVARERALALARLQSEYRKLHDDLARAADSRTWRYGHRLAGLLRVLTLHPPVTTGALDRALGRIERWESATSKPSHPPSATPLQNPERRWAWRRRRYLDADPVVGRREQIAREEFSRRYAEAVDRWPFFFEEGVGLVPIARDVLIPAESATGGSGPPTVEVVVCVHNALDDVKSCLSSLVSKATYPFHLILVDDGSDAETAELLARFAEELPTVTLLRKPDPPHGYTLAANLGLRASRADYVVLLNSDTIVTRGWLERIVDCGESDDRIGVIGPLSNAASHQSVPELVAEGGWAVNTLPDWLGPDGMAFLVERISRRKRPRFPFINGFCYVIKRRALDSVGYFDEERFGSGYGEENDFSYRAAGAGFELAVADDAYVFHAKSRSYGPGGRGRIAAWNFERLRDKHGAEEIARLVEELETDQGLSYLRQGVETATGDADRFRSAFASVCPSPLRVGFVLPGMARGDSGGIHSIYQEAGAMRDLGIETRIMVPVAGLHHARETYEGADSLFTPFEDSDDLASATSDLDVIVATHFKSVPLVKNLLERGDSFLPAYYIQDYEPFTVEEGSADAAEAAASYTAIPGQLHFAKTDWVRSLVSLLHGVPVAKVEPSIDRSIFYPEIARRDNGRVRVVAMVRPRTPRRQPLRTLEVLDRLRREHPDRVEVLTFGCDDEQFDRLCAGQVAEHFGLLNRSEVAALLRASDVFVDLSIYQAFGRTGLEAMSSGCVSVMPRVGGAREFCRDGENSILVDSGDLEAVHQALTWVVSDEDRLRRLQAAAIESSRRYSVLGAALSEYVLFESEHRRRFRRRTPHVVAVA